MSSRMNTFTGYMAKIASKNRDFVPLVERETALKLMPQLRP